MTTEWTKIHRSREDFDNYLNRYDIGFENFVLVPDSRKRAFLRGLRNACNRNLNVLDEQKRMTSRGNFGIDYPKGYDQSITFFGNMKEFIIYPTIVYAYRAYKWQDSFIAIAGKFRDNLTEEEKSMRHSERLFKEKSNGIMVTCLPLTCPPFNPLYILPYGSDKPKNFKDISDSLFEDLVDILKER